MTEDELMNIRLPPAKIQVTGSNSATFAHVQGTVYFALDKDDNDLWYLKGEFDCERGKSNNRVLLESEDILDIIEGSLHIDAYCQDQTFQQHQKELAERLVLEVQNEDLRFDREQIQVELGQYIPQAHSVTRSKLNLLNILFDSIKLNHHANSIPDHLKVTPPRNFLPDMKVLASLKQRMYEGTPAIALVGPTGSGKSALARYLGSELNKSGYGIHIIDANARLEGDRLFDRDDFDADGTFILEGVLCTLARETQRMGLKLLVILEEYNAFTDETRREFYRLFSDEDRFYPIQSSKDHKLIDNVDFSHVQFLLTANPLGSEKYLTDDLKRLSNAETRRLVIIYQDYEMDKERLKNIFFAIIHKKGSYQLLKAEEPNIDEFISLDLGLEIFLALNKREQGIGLGFDVGYSAIADMLWTATLRQHQRDNLVEALLEHILNCIPDVNVRSLAADHIRQAVGIHIPEELIYRDA